MPSSRARTVRRCELPASVYTVNYPSRTPPGALDGNVIVGSDGHLLTVDAPSGGLFVPKLCNNIARKYPILCIPATRLHFACDLLHHGSTLEVCCSSFLDESFDTSRTYSRTNTRTDPWGGSESGGSAACVATFDTFLAGVDSEDMSALLRATVDCPPGTLSLQSNHQISILSAESNPGSS